MWIYILLLMLSNVIIHTIFSFQAKNVDIHSFKEIAKFQMYVIPAFFVVNLMTGYAYMVGKGVFGSMTMSVASGYIIKTVALVVITFLFFNETVSLRVFIGLTLMVVGAIIAQS